MRGTNDNFCSTASCQISVQGPSVASLFHIGTFIFREYHAIDGQCEQVSQVQVISARHGHLKTRSQRVADKLVRTKSAAVTIGIFKWVCRQKRITGYQILL